MVGVARLWAVIDQDAVENPRSDEGAQFVFQLVIGGGHGAYIAADVGGHTGPDHRHVGVADVIGKIDPLFVDRRDPLPICTHGRDEPRQQRNREANNSSAKRAGKVPD